MRSKSLQWGGWSLLCLLLVSKTSCSQDIFLPERGSSLVARQDVDVTVTQPNDFSNRVMAQVNDKPVRGRSEYDNDSVEKFAEDVARVITVLRPERIDPAIWKMFQNTQLPSFVYTWSRKDWEVHSSRKRYLDYMITLPTSRLLKRIWPALVAVMTWSAIACWLLQREASFFGTVPLTPLSLLSTFVAGLLTLRSNQGLTRLGEGRRACGKVVLFTRDLSQMIAAIVYSKDKALGLRAARHLSVVGWLVRNFLRGDDIERGGSDETAVLNTMLSPADAAFVMSHRKRPVAVFAVLRQIFAFMHNAGQLTTSQNTRLDSCLQELNNCVMVVERIQASAIPPLYSVHAGRLLIFFLAGLPFALYGVFESTRATMIAVTVCAYTMLGLDEISHILEEPFRLMPIWDLSKNSMRDVADAIVCQPPPLFVPTNTLTTPNGLESPVNAVSPKSQAYW